MGATPQLVGNTIAVPPRSVRPGTGPVRPLSGTPRRIAVMAALACMSAFLYCGAVSGAPPYPRVYGPAGSLYGPTQAEYQYQLRYGRPWWGRSATVGVTATPVPVGVAVPVGIPFACGPYAVPWTTGWGLSINTGWGSFFWYERYYGAPWIAGPIYGPVPPWIAPPVDSIVGLPLPSGAAVGAAPQITFGWPKQLPAADAFGGTAEADRPHTSRPSTEPVAFTNEVIRKTLEENRRRWEQPLKFENESAPRLKRPARTSTPAARTKSRILVARAGQWMRRGEYHTALQRYRQATDAAPDLPDGWHGQAMALAAIGRFELAADRLRNAVLRDPDWPVRAPSLDDLFGGDSLRKLSTLDRLAVWTREDIRDPDRLFLLGALLFFDGQVDKARPFLETAYRLAGEGAHIAAFFESRHASDNGARNEAADSENGADLEHLRKKLDAIRSAPEKPTAPGAGEPASRR